MEAWRTKFREMHNIDYLPKAEIVAFEELIERFKKQYPSLMELEPELGITHIGQDEDGNPLNLNFLALGHPFIFDYRLIPEGFEKFEIKPVLCEKMPKEFPESTLAWLYGQTEEYYTPERYRLFVDRSINLIRQRLKSKNMSINEALDALTGGFDQHVEKTENLKNKRIMEHKDHIAFFNSILKKTESAYIKSDVYKNYREKDWGYSVTATSFEKNEKVIVGFNWGVDKEWVDNGNAYGAQMKYPLKNFASNYEDLGSFKRTLNFFYKYFESLPQVQINYCFFRSETESQITPDDLDLCVDLFGELIDYLEPSMLITFSKSLNNYLKQQDGFTYKDKIIQSGNRQFSVTKGTIDISEKIVPYYNLPHPNYPIRRESREEAWKYCFGEPKY